MGSPGSGAAGCTVGSIVWVRRRNGSWWPGKILGPEELDATHLTSPRSGTPVKLLGREDASVDWYNLEKSKRVKAFRCGDFDDCIERVESSQGLPIRKREKYARREDAILHALELEKELLKKQGKSVPDKVRNKSSGSAKEELAISGTLDVGSGKPECVEHLRSSHVGSSLYLLKEKEDDQPSAEDDHIEAAPRMRGLQDFGLRTASSKQKVPSASGLDASLKPMACSISPASSGGDIGMERGSQACGKEQIGGTPRVKRTRYMYSPAESMHALGFKESSSSQMEMLPSSYGDDDSYFRHHSTMNTNPSGYLQDVGPDSSDSNSDSSETEEDTDDDFAMFSGLARGSEPGEDAFRRRVIEEDESTSGEEHDESSLSGETSYLYRHDPVFANETVSKWQLKGKRNVRNLTRRSMDKTDAGYYNGSEHGPCHKLRKTVTARNPSGYDFDFHGVNDLSDGTDEVDTGDKDFGVQMMEHHNGVYSLSMKAAPKTRNNSSHNLLDWGEDPWEGCISKKRHLDDKIRLFDQMFAPSWRFDGKMRFRLIDVDLEVRSSYQKQPVPIVSLMSKLDSRAIIGHPIQIEVLRDGSSENMLHTSDYLSSETTYHDKTFLLPPAWRTARRSNSRVPRPHPSSSLEAYDAADEGRPPFKKLISGNFSTNFNLVKKNGFRVPRPPADRRQQKKLPKKVSASASQKTRALSSIGVEQCHGMKPTRDGKIIQMDGFINKTECLGPPTVACIPVKLVFSRLLEKINRPPSKAATKTVLSNDARRDPS